jgi:hypothetical protein
MKRPEYPPNVITWENQKTCSAHFPLSITELDPEGVN